MILFFIGLSLTLWLIASFVILVYNIQESIKYKIDGLRLLIHTVFFIIAMTGMACFIILVFSP